MRVKDSAAQKNVKYLSLKKILILAVSLLALYVFLPSLGSFKNTFSTLLSADLSYLSLAVVSWLVTFLAAATVYKLIAIYHLAYWRTLLVQIASGFTNRLLPAGMGALAINTRFLMKSGHNIKQATAVVTLNNLLGFLENFLLLTLVIIFGNSSLASTWSFQSIRPPFYVVLLIGAFLAGSIFFIYATKNNKVRTFYKMLKELIQSIFERPKRILFALLAAIVITVGYVTCLYFVELALNVHLTIFQTFIIFTLGVAASAVTPTPGGVGGTEAVLVTALMSAGVPAHQSLTVALTYRFITYWLAIIPGFVCFQLALKNEYI